MLYARHCALEVHRHSWNNSSSLFVSPLRLDKITYAFLKGQGTFWQDKVIFICHTFAQLSSIFFYWNKWRGSSCWAHWKTLKIWSKFFLWSWVFHTCFHSSCPWILLCISLLEQSKVQLLQKGFLESFSQVISFLITLVLIFSLSHTYSYVLGWVLGVFNDLG